MKNLSRRDFLKLGGLTLAGLAFTSFLPETTPFDDAQLIRVATDLVSVYKEPNDQSEIVRTWVRDDLVHVYGSVEVETPGNTPVWYRVLGGYLHAARLQKVQFHYNVPLDSVPDTKLLAEVTVPYTLPYRYNKWDGWQPIDYRLYYNSTQWITDIDAGPDGKAWYVVQDEADKNIFFYVPAVQLRPIPAEEFAPIAPELAPEKKRIDINLRTQTLTCYQEDQLVRTADISSGLFGLYPTPIGRFNVQVKLPSRRMRATNLFAEDFALSGVPWCSFFTTEGHALHGTYWHDNFGHPMSHGCVNMRNEDALWVFRWSRPRAGFDDIDKATLDVKGYGTLIDLHY